MAFNTEAQSTQSGHRVFQPLCYLCGLCVSVVNLCFNKFN
jgi:hypothetical protein